MIFTFVWAGWEGIAHDSRVLTEVACNPTSGVLFPPPSKYYLYDAAYTNTRGFMTPYHNTRRCNIQDRLFMEYDENMFTIKEQDEGIEEESIEEDVGETQWGPQGNEYMTDLCDRIANQLMLNA
ncbi:uncharacterized protein LOC112502416 [Cynara cardunculus var. scolymus]|uniref:uncharacterized protein LOC112502416 n=1 Tax=Cynara cardunculus var. scolymus TaxID=59895 RepID=UPI000D62DB39|nr:uncharacterized protein LOC112502416 [Cynara cardunculus var. scolymus]